MSSDFDFLVPGHVTSIIFTCTKKLTYKIWLQMALWFLRKKQVLIFIFVNGLEPRSRNDLDLQYSHIFINLISCLHIPTFRSQAAIISEISIVFTFSYRKAYVTKFDLAVN